MRRMVFVVVAFMLGALGACSTLEVDDDVTRSESAAPSTTAVSEHVPSVTQVKHPWKEGDFQNGIQLYWRSDSEYTQVDATRILDYVVDLGANAIGLSFPIYVDGATPTQVYAGEKTPSVADLRLVIKEAKMRKLRVMMRPLIDEDNIVEESATAWRGTIGMIAPFEPSVWFDNYRAFLAPYLRMSEQQGVEEFVLGSELTGLQSAGQWRSLIDSSRKLYSGTLSYAMNWMWQPKPAGFSEYGIDLYPPLQLGDDASVRQLTDALTRWLKQQQSQFDTPLTVHEIGIQAQDTAYQHPWGFTTDDTRVNLTIQGRWFEAAYRATRKAGAEGAYYWSVDSTQQLGEDLDVDAQPPGNFMGRPGEASIRRMFK